MILNRPYSGRSKLLWGAAGFAAVSLAIFFRLYTYSFTMPLQGTGTMKTYLMEADPFYYLQLTEQLLQKDAPPTQTRGRNYFNDSILAPEGIWMAREFHPYAGVAAYKLSRLISKNIPLETVAAAVPLFFAGCCAIPFLLICGKIFRADPWPSFVSVVYLLLAPIFLRRTLWGWYDTDAYNILFPLLILYSLMLSFEEKFASRKNVIYLMFSVLFSAIYSLFWRGWLLGHLMIGVALMMTAVISLIDRKANQKKGEVALTAFIYVLGPSLVIILFWGWDGALSVWVEALELLRGFCTPNFSVWPDVSLQIGELLPSNFFWFCGIVGGLPFLVLSAIAILWELFDRSPKRTFSKNTAWLVASLFVLTLGPGLSFKRYALFMITPIALGITLGTRRLPRKLTYFLCVGLLAYSLWNARETVRVERPIYTASWDRVMTYLKEKTPKNSMVVSWWPPGYYITSVAKRRVILTGGTQNSPQSYWISDCFMQNSEEIALGILRMLALSGNRAVDYLIDKKMSLAEAMQLLHEILPLDSNAALEKLQRVTAVQDPASLLSLTHGSQAPPPLYLFVYDDMVSSAVGMEYVGKWDFKKAEDFSENLRKGTVRNSGSLLRRFSKEHIQLVWSLADGPYAQEDEAYAVRKTGPILTFTNGLQFNTDLFSVKFPSENKDFQKPKNIYFLYNGELTKKVVPDADSNLSVLLVKKSPVRAILADSKLIESLLFRFAYLQGAGLKHFKLVAAEEDARGKTKFLLYEVLWNS